MLCAIVSLASVWVRPGLGSSVVHQRSAGLVASLVPAADVAEIEWLWASASKPLLRVGGKGAGLSHANGLADLCSSQHYVCVRLTGAGASESLAQLVELAPSAPLAAAPGSVPVLLAHRAPRKGGVEALFARQEMVEVVLSADFRKADVDRRRADQEDAEEWADARAASAAKQARRADKVASKQGAVRMRRPSGSSPRVTGAQMGVGGDSKAKYKSVDELEAAVRAYAAALPDGALDDPSLPSPLSYKELQYNGRPDLVEGCMNFGGYLKLSEQFGLPVRLGVERSADEAEQGSLRSEVGKKTINAFNMFGKLDTASGGGLTEGEAAVGDAAKKAVKKAAGLTGRILGLPDTGKW